MKKMVRKLVMVMMIVSLGVFANGLVMAGKGGGMMGSCRHFAMAGTLATADMVTITGIVQDYAMPGIVIDTDKGEVTVYGLGPAWFWVSAGVDKPSVGEEVSVDAYEITFSNGTTRLIASSITVGDQTIQLRDDDGTPVWRNKEIIGKNCWN